MQEEERGHSHDAPNGHDQQEPHDQTDQEHTAAGRLRPAPREVAADEGGEPEGDEVDDR